jgi:hypothetical protein
MFSKRFARAVTATDRTAHRIAERGVSGAPLQHLLGDGQTRCRDATHR